MFFSGARESVDDEAFFESDDEALFENDDEAFFESDDEGVVVESHFKKEKKKPRSLGRQFRAGPARSIPTRRWQGQGAPVGPGGRRVPTTQQVKAQFEVLAKDSQKVGKDVATVAKAVEKVDQARVETVDRLASFEKSIDKKFKDVDAKSQQSLLLPLLLGSKPKLSTINVTETVGGKPVLKTLTVEDTKYKDDSSDMLPLLLMMGGGGLGQSGNTSGTSNDMMSNPLMLILMLKLFDK
jgi:hypothetical protein